jgi:D-tagatose-1,6-bisphosphate aldolase subunit GatZ/KbaZ
MSASRGHAGPASPSAILLETAAANRAGARAGVCSVCSANRLVLEAALAAAAAADSVALIESTCNQVNQFGGYTGMTPAAFREQVLALAGEAGCDPARVILGGDHLGPHVWRTEPTDQAMAKACDLVRDCVLAGYTKIHLDASMRLADDPGSPGAPPDTRLAAERAAELAAAAETAWGGLPAGSPPPVYVVGTEVPVPGGELAGAGPVAVTGPRDAERTLLASEDAFRRRGLSGAWSRVLALVVQPGVDFGGEAVTRYERERARELVAWLEGLPTPLVFEAHSTDYQTAAALRELVSDHFAVLKVGPALTFALREAVFSLEAAELATLRGRAGAAPSGVRDALEQAMRADPRHWRPYAESDDDLARAAYGLSDRARYYWAEPAVERALERLLAGVAPERARVGGRSTDDPSTLIRRRVGEALAPYAAACGAE